MWGIDDFGNEANTSTLPAATTAVPAPPSPDSPGGVTPGAQYPYAYTGATEEEGELELEIIDEEEITTEDEEELEEVQKKGYPVKIKVVDKEGKPVEGAKVEMHSNVLVEYTDADGIAEFENVPAGKHTIIVSYEGYEGEQEVVLGTEDDVEEGVKEYSYTIEISPVSGIPPLMYGVVVVLAVVVVVLTFMMLRRKRKDVGSE